MKKKLFVIKNMKTGKYYTGQNLCGPCTSKNIETAQHFDEAWVKRTLREQGDDYGLPKNEKFVEIEIREKK